MFFSLAISLLHWRLLRVGPALRTSPLSCAASAPIVSPVGRAFLSDGRPASSTRPIVRHDAMMAIQCRSQNLKKPGPTAPGSLTALRATKHRRSARTGTLTSSRARSSGTPALKNHFRMWPLLGGFITPLQIAAVSAAAAIQYVETFPEFARWVKATRPQALTGPEPPDLKRLDLAGAALLRAPLRAGCAIGDGQQAPRRPLAPPPGLGFEARAGVPEIDPKFARLASPSACCHSTAPALPPAPGDPHGHHLHQQTIGHRHLPAARVLVLPEAARDEQLLRGTAHPAPASRRTACTSPTGA